VALQLFILLGEEKIAWVEMLVQVALHGPNEGSSRFQVKVVFRQVDATAIFRQKGLCMACSAARFI